DAAHRSPGARSGPARRFAPGTLHMLCGSGLLSNLYDGSERSGAGLRFASVHSKVLVVEDDREMAAAIADVLERFGFCPVRAHTAGQCMERWQWADLVLLDLGL